MMYQAVMAGRDPAISLIGTLVPCHDDGRVKPGHDVFP